MSRKGKNSLDTVEIVMVIEEVFDIEIPGDLGPFASSREIVDRMEAAPSKSPAKQGSHGATEKPGQRAATT